MDRRVFLALALAAPQAVGAQAAPSIQALFNAAEAADEKGDLAGAVEGYQKIEAALARSTNRRSIAIVRVRKGDLLYRLGRSDEAEAALRAGLPDLPATDASLRSDRVLALVDLGSIAERRVALEEANAHYAEAAARATGGGLEIQALAGLARTEMFTNAAAAVKHADAGLALVAKMPVATKAVLAQWRTLKGRALMNSGAFDLARIELTTAMEELGGLTRRVDTADIAARSDLAIAAMLAGRKEDARRYLANTGAGQFKDGGLGRGADYELPECGGESGLRPEDVAIVQFSIEDDGSVGAVAPIYASRQGNVAAEFARKVRGWSWQADQVKTIEPFFRRLTRLELRCTTAVDRPSPIKLLKPAIVAWMEAKGLQDFDSKAESGAAAVSKLRGELARREAAKGAAAPDLIPVLVQLGSNPALSGKERTLFLARGDALARAVGAPAPMLAYIALGLAGASERTTSGQRRGDYAGAAALLIKASNDPVIAVDGASVAVLKIGAADNWQEARRRADALPLLEQVAGDKRLARQDPLRVGALIRLSSIKAAGGDLAAARAAFEETGLGEAQCALVDAQPSLKSSTTTGAFPQDALRWGFSGWTITEFDIRADGRTASVRPIISYPPLIFGSAAQSIIGNARFTQSYRPQGGLGCGAQTQSLRFNAFGS